MKSLDLIRALKGFKNGWVAIDEKKNIVVAHSTDFTSLIKKIGSKKYIFLMPASEEYYGFITLMNA